MGSTPGPTWQTAPASPVLDELPRWVTLLRADNPGPMTLDGTNTWVLRAPGAAAGVLVDPGPRAEAHLEAIAAAAPIGLILVTHGHPDHVEGLDRAVDLFGGVPVMSADPGHPVEEYGLRLTALRTPGHTADSICYLADCGPERVVLTGDTILGRGTTVVAWPDGNLGEYLDSLRRLSGYRGVAALPGHGPALADCGAAARFYLDHRRARLAQVEAAVAAGAVTPADVVARVYADVDRRLWPAAELSVRAQLEYLRRESPPGTDRLKGP